MDEQKKSVIWREWERRWQISLALSKSLLLPVFSISSIMAALDGVTDLGALTR